MLDDSGWCTIHGEDSGILWTMGCCIFNSGRLSRTMRTSFSIVPSRWVYSIAVIAAIGCGGGGSGNEPKRNRDGFAELHVAARAVDMEKVHDLLLYGADPNVVDNYGVTPLHRAARDGHDALVTELVRFSADLDPKTNTGWTPLHLAIRAGDIEMVDLLLGYGASAHLALPEGRTPLIYAAERDEAAIANSLILMGSIDASAAGTQNINATDVHGNSALLLAVLRGNGNLAVSLLTSGANANVRNKKQQTPLHIAVKNDDLLVAGMLLESGASLLARGPGGENAIVAARNLGNWAMVELLVSYLPNAP